MSVLNRMEMREMLNSYETRNWIKATNIEGVQHKLGIADTPGVKPAETGGVVHSSFADFLITSINRVNNLQRDANKAIERLVTGETQNIHQTMLAVEQAELSFKAMNQVRAKVIDAYQEIIRMQI